MRVRARQIGTEAPNHKIDIQTGNIRERLKPPTSPAVASPCGPKTTVSGERIPERGIVWGSDYLHTSAGVHMPERLDYGAGIIYLDYRPCRFSLSAIFDTCQRAQAEADRIYLSLTTTMADVEESLHDREEFHLRSLGHLRLRHEHTNEIILTPSPSLDPNDPLRW